ncbi:hypothetical protein LIER_22325 [Lithospermum erythrorhizon]|uniref:Uncharacterized protein n=1 Tax=Lithospermum erythrorhizon TaxID=34254 RepID=A0AAV3QTM0_LITER
MDIQHGKIESLRAYHSRYNNLLLNILMVDDKVEYMAFFKGSRYRKLKKALLSQTPLYQDELIGPVTTDIELEEFKVGAEKPVDLRETVFSKERNVSPKKPLATQKSLSSKDGLASDRERGGELQKERGEENSRKKYARREVYRVVNT